MNDQSKFARYRSRKRAAGLRELRMWVSDVNVPGFQARLDKQIAAINASRSSREAQAWIDAVIADDPEFYC